MRKLLKKAIWDFHTKSLLAKLLSLDYPYKPPTDLCDLILDTLGMALFYTTFMLYSLFITSGVGLYLIVGGGEILYADTAVEYLLGTLIVITFMSVVYWVSEYWDTISKPCRVIDFSDMEEKDKHE